ncbi:MAG: Sec-independent protein translocase protein TatB [Candidatus Calescibacterium sp.]|nr:Sec-independent protein translocase protein TatB [Candidatus Calescibacterium sp.]MCX7734725.1 Sec-independent protein translocase protein TatB [bacterium]MDW8087293.1 Sec-independent protein translocase protein TatB [Candidatus Calescibacterium sp.]
MFGIGWQELVVIIVVALIVVGPKRIPEFARSLAKVIRDFVRAREQVKRKIQEELKLYEEETYLQIKNIDKYKKE